MAGLVIPERVVSRLIANQPIKPGPRYYEVNDSGCWVWQRARHPDGYGLAQWREDGHGVYRGAHRVMYELLVGEIPEGLDLDHLCRNPPCCNPAHLEPVTRKENVARGIGHGSETHCPAGHPYTSGNIYPRKGGGRRCRACTLRQNAESKRRRQLRRSAA